MLVPPGPYSAWLATSVSEVWLTHTDTHACTHTPSSFYIDSQTFVTRDPGHLGDLKLLNVELISGFLYLLRLASLTI